jgi:hypothetical protein
LESDIEVLGRLLSSEEKIFCYNRSKSNNIYTKLIENKNIAKSMCPYLKLSYLSVLDGLATIAHCLSTILLLVRLLQRALPSAADGVVMEYR